MEEILLANFAPNISSDNLSLSELFLLLSFVTDKNYSAILFKRCLFS